MATNLTRRSVLKLAGATGIVAGCASPVASPPPAASLAPRRGGTLTFATGSEIVTLDPVNIGDSASTNVMFALYQGLAGFTPELEVKPALATKWDVQEKVWTFTLRPGVKFHDGTPFDAAAVKAHFDRLIGPDSLRRGIWQPILDRVEVVDPGTVRITTKFVDPYFLTRIAGVNAFIESPTAVAKFGKDYLKNPVGTGPFKFVEWIKDERVVVARNDDFWGDKAYLDRVVFRPVADSSARLVALESGDVQMGIRLDPEHLSRVQQSTRLSAIVRVTNRTLFIGMNVLKKPFSDLRVRQALNHAVDKDSIVKNLYLGTADVIGGAVSASSFDYVAQPGFAYDVAKAKQLLADAGYPNGFSATMYGTRGNYVKDAELQQAVQQYLKAVGVTINLQTVEFAKYLELIRMNPQTSPLEMWQDAWGSGTAADEIENRYGCDYFRPKGGNTAGFCDPQISQLAQQAMGTIDEAKRRSLLTEAQQKISVAAPSIWILVLKQIAGISKKLHEPVFMKNELLTVDEHTWLEA